MYDTEEKCMELAEKLKKICEAKGSTPYKLATTILKNFLFTLLEIIFFKNRYLLYTLVEYMKFTFPFLYTRILTPH